MYRSKTNMCKKVSCRRGSHDAYMGHISEECEHQRMLALIFSSRALSPSRSPGGLRGLAFSLPCCCCSRDSRSWDSWDSSKSIEEGTAGLAPSTGRLDLSSSTWGKGGDGGNEQTEEMSRCQLFPQKDRPLSFRRTGSLVTGVRLVRLHQMPL